MAPKKKQQKQQSTSKSSQASKSKTKSQSSGSGPRLQISAENENRLRRLLLNSDRSTQPSSAAVTAQDTLTKSQKAKKLKSIYESLSCEGFSDDQIELALSSLKDNASFESALDWLCLNIPGNELPLKFASATSLSTNEGSVTVLLTSKDDEVPSVAPTAKHKEDMDRIVVRNKHLDEDNQLESCQPSQADWIRQYMEQQEEDESGTWEDEADNGVFSDKRDSEPRSYDIIAQEYHAARLEASKAKEKGDKKGQEQAGHAIRKLKKELSALGLSDYVLAKEFEREHASFSGSKDAVSSSTITEHHNEGMTLPDSECGSALLAQADKLLLSGKEVENLSSEELPDKPVSSAILGEGKTVLEDDGDDGLCNFFFDDDASNKALPPTVLELQKAERMKELYSKENFEKLDGIWKKGEAKKIPKALLHQLCQKSGWDAPKFSKVDSRKGFSYAVSILRKASGRGKSRKAGGLVTIQLPDQIENFNSAEDAQNMVAAFSIHQLFPDLPLYLAIAEPYASLLLQWKEGGSSNNVEDTLKDRRSGFVDRLLNAESSIATGVLDAADSVRSNLSVEEANTSTNDTAANPVERKTNLTNDVESSYLRNEQENKLKTQRYKEMLKTRASLPIHSLKGDILCKLKEHDVLVVCGETGSGKTTQVPQFILDDMIESGKGGSCNIICTQPRRIAAISVAERVADERCEPSPGSVGSLIGYQVRLDSARNERTKLLFCTTGILLRKLAGDRNLTGVTHILVDEVHERSILGDFLLIVLKNLIEKQSAHGTRKLKVILMSATVDSKLFSNYFGHCPVLNAQGRTHPVTTYFLEDIYEDINYRLASDSSAALRNETSAFNKGGTVNNRRGKKNLVLSSWGDDSLLSEDLINPHYVASNYQSYSKQTNDNLKRLNEDIIDYDLLEDLICHVDETCDEGAILVFLPGVSEIYALHDQLAASYRFGGVSADWILPLHSSIASTDQKKVFQRPPENIRKIIIATNIAETSITIDDVVYVIDCGKHKENRYNPQKKLSSMVEDWISKANARQRRGRAGRVKPGICFCLYTRHRFEKIMHPYQTPEMLRMPLVELCLQIKVLSLGHIKPFLSEALEPPTEETMDRAISSLYEVGALEGDEELTPLGHHLAKLPVDVLVGKMMLYGAVFGCLSPILSIAAFLSYKSPFVYPKDEKQNVERAKMSLFTNMVGGLGDANEWDRQSDHLLMIIAYRKWEKILRENGDGAAQQFCNSYFLSSSVMYMIRDMRIQFATLLADIGLINLPKKIVGQKKDIVDSWLSDKSQKFNLYSHHSSIVKAILCAGLYPNVAATEDGIAERILNSIKHSSNPAAKQVWYDGRREVHIHPSSINSNLKTFRHPFLVFLEKVETSKVFLRDTTIVSPFSIMLFGGTINIQHQAGLVIVDEWLKLTAPAQSAVLFKEFHSTLRSLLNKLIRKPENAGVVDNDVVRSMIQLLLDEDK